MRRLAGGDENASTAGVVPRFELSLLARVCQSPFKRRRASRTAAANWSGVGDSSKDGMLAGSEIQRCFRFVQIWAIGSNSWLLDRVPARRKTTPSIALL